MQMQNIMKNSPREIKPTRDTMTSTAIFFNNLNRHHTINFFILFAMSKIKCELNKFICMKNCLV